MGSIKDQTFQRNPNNTTGEYIELGTWPALKPLYYATTPLEWR